MGGIASKELVAAVSNAGGFGVVGSALAVANMGPDELRTELESVRDMCNGQSVANCVRSVQRVGCRVLRG